MVTNGDDELVEAGDRNLRDAWRALLAGAEESRMEEDDELLLISTNAPLAFFNPVFVKEPATDAGAVLERVHRFFGPAHVPFVVWVRYGTHTDLVERAGAAGLRVDQGPPGMVMQPIGDPPPAPAGLEVVEVRGPDLLGSTVDVIAAGFDMPIALCHRLMGPDLLKVGEVAVFAGRVDGIPVSSATLVATDSDLGPVAGIYSVATPQGNRGRGFGEAVTWAAVAEGRRRGCGLASLQSSPMGYGVYERMGFRTVCGYHHLVGGP